jgi:hypothetical protein
MHSGVGTDSGFGKIGSTSTVKYNLFFVFTYLFLFIYLLKCHLILNACMFVQLNPRVFLQIYLLHK